MLTEIKNLNLSLTKTEQLIVKARTESPAFCQIPEKDKQWHLDQILLRGASVSGSTIPQTAFYAQILSDELDVYIQDHLNGELSYEELLLALRLNTRADVKEFDGVEVSFVPFSGSCFNIGYFAKVVSNYMIIRNTLDRKLQNFIDGYK